jgi:DNA-binding NarL/FixJ family response regulator
MDIAKNADQAATLLQRSRYDLVLLDACLEGNVIDSDSQLLWESLRQDYSDLPVVVVTGWPLEPPEMARVFLQACPVDFIYKQDFDLQDFRRRILDALEKRPSSPEARNSNWDTAAIRELVTAAFSDEELTTFCFDRFRSVHEQFGGGMSKSQKVQQLLDYCVRYSQLEELLKLIKECNPDQYRRFQSQVYR